MISISAQCPSFLDARRVSAGFVRQAAPRRLAVRPGGRGKPLQSQLTEVLASLEGIRDPFERIEKVRELVAPDNDALYDQLIIEFQNRCLKKIGILGKCRIRLRRDSFSDQEVKVWLDRQRKSELNRFYGGCVRNFKIPLETLSQKKLIFLALILEVWQRLKTSAHYCKEPKKPNPIIIVDFEDFGPNELPAADFAQRQLFEGGIDDIGQAMNRPYIFLVPKDMIAGLRALYDKDLLVYEQRPYFDERLVWAADVEHFQYNEAFENDCLLTNYLAQCTHLRHIPEPYLNLLILTESILSPVNPTGKWWLRR